MEEYLHIFVARQAIFDRNSCVHAYELLYRAHAGCDTFTGDDEDGTTLDVIASSLLTIGLNNIAAGKKAYINFGRNLLVEGLAAILPKESVVIEVLETTEPDSDVVKCCGKLRDLGYTIALDDFVADPRYEPLVATAKIIKVDMRVTSRAEQERLVALYQPRGIAMLAEKVETREEFEWAVNLGYDYFQGYFFARPDVVSQKEIHPVVVTCLQLLRQLQNLEINFKELEGLVRKDVALTYKLFRYVNSALLSRGGNIQSIRAALVRLGEDGIRRWATVATFPRIAQHKPEELVACAMLRARFSENLARMAGDPRYPSAYLIGLFSVLDALLDLPLAQALDEVGLAPMITDVLLAAPGADERLARIHKLLGFYEAGEWEQVRLSTRSLGLTDALVTEAYVNATEWANEIVSQLRVSEPTGTAKAPQAAPRKERRRINRDPITGSVAIIYGTQPHEERLAQANLVDVSPFGARFRIMARVPPGSWVMFNHHKVGISGRGTVRHCRLVKGMYEIGVEFPGGTGWDAVLHRFSTHLKNLGDAIDRLQVNDSGETAQADALGLSGRKAGSDNVS
jgi:c-di-GMP-related signal transduction protein